MKVLVVCSYNNSKIAPFIIEQVAGLQKKEIEVEYFTIKRKGITGYLFSRKALISKIHTFTPDLIHAHYGLSGLLANLQSKIPVVTTYHGSDINNSRSRFFSRFAITLSDFNIFVSQKLIDIAKPHSRYIYLPCGVDLSLFVPEAKMDARKKLHLDEANKCVLFSGSFSDEVKNCDLAKKAVAKLPHVQLLELNGYTRQQVAQLLNAVDAVLMTSFTEGSPQIIKEAMACNCPIVSTDVGEVKKIIGDTKGCYITNFDPDDVAGKLKLAIAFEGRTSGREGILRFDNDQIVDRIIQVYHKVLEKA